MKDKLLKILLFVSASILLLLMAGILYLLISESIPALKQFGIMHFITSSEWDTREGQEQYGALPFLAGTFITTLLALVISIPFSFSIILFIGEFFKDKKIGSLTGYTMNLLSYFPSIVFGLWGYYILRNLFIDWNIGSYGYGILTASIVLALMIIPYTVSMGVYFIAQIPQKLREEAYCLGATRLDVIKHISLPMAKTGILSAYLLSIGKIMGETIIVTMLIGNSIQIPSGITQTGNTLSSIIVNQMGAVGTLQSSSLMAITLLLFLITAVINFIMRYIVRRRVDLW
jgi:phosphate transport system permease protein